MAEFTNTRTVNSIDRRITAINSITGGHAPAASIPIWYDTDREVLENALTTIGLATADRAKVIQIPDTLHMAEVLVSEAYLEEIKTRPDLEIVTQPQDLQFDAAGNLLPVGISH
jgi:hypothetical protein